MTQQCQIPNLAAATFAKIWAGWPTFSRAPLAAGSMHLLMWRGRPRPRKSGSARLQSWRKPSLTPCFSPGLSQADWLTLVRTHHGIGCPTFRGFRKVGSTSSRSSHPQLGSPLLVHQDNSFFSIRIVSKTAPLPLPGLQYQSAFTGFSCMYRNFCSRLALLHTTKSYNRDCQKCSILSRQSSA